MRGSNATRSVLLGVALTVASSACARPARESCPPPTRGDASRTARIVALLGKVDTEAASRARTASSRVCFGSVVVSGVTPEGHVLLAADMPDALAAARVAHLVLHGPEQGGRKPEDQDCLTWVDARLEAESHAYGVELRVARALGVDPPYAFVPAYWAAPAEARDGVVLDFLREHPYGGGGIDAIGAGYAARCAGP